MYKYSLCGLVSLLIILGCSREAPVLLDDLSSEEESLVNAILKVEDARPSTSKGLQPFYEGLSAAHAEVRRIAVRGLGRLEQPALGSDIVLVLAEDKSPSVRIEAANALAQSAYRGDVTIAYPALLQALSVELDSEVHGAVAQALGRLPMQGVDTLSRVEQALLAASATDSPVALLSVARGFESFSRLHREHGLTDQTVARLEALTGYGRTATNEDQGKSAHIRRLAIATLISSGKMIPSIISDALEDADHEVRRLAVRGIEQLALEVEQTSFFEVARKDAHFTVRTEALRLYGRALQKTAGCVIVLQMVNDPNPQVALSAIDLLGVGCETGESHAAMISKLMQLTESLPDSSPKIPTWHQPAHALVALAGLSPDRAKTKLSRYAEHGIWQVRMYAARAAESCRVVSLLEALAADPHPNVAGSSLNGLHSAVGHAADDQYIAALKRGDYALLLTAARRLQGSSHPGALSGILEAFTRISRERRETSRNPRRTMLERIGELGDASITDALRPYLRDFDPIIAERTADIITGWTGDVTQADTKRLPTVAVPDVQELRTFEASRPVLVMEDGREITLRLLPLDAATNVARFVRLAKKGYYDGLTFHRVVPNFVIQGGSPGANEFVGDGPFTRDELTNRSHLRGTIGISTRGRDTGDAQIFVNLVDNIRLDHNYTIIADVVKGMDAVDDLLEGGRIARVRIP